jgi:hypothetical protein
VEKVIADEFAASPSYGGRSVFGWERAADGMKARK